jgi:hypothetical protein
MCGVGKEFASYMSAIFSFCSSFFLRTLLLTGQHWLPALLVTLFLVPLAGLKIKALPSSSKCPEKSNDKGQYSIKLCNWTAISLVLSLFLLSPQGET